MAKRTVGDSFPAVKARVNEFSKSSQPEILRYQGKGVLMCAQGRVGNPTGKGGGLRGKVKGWSLASRRRMRLYLLTHEPEPGYEVYGVTLTVPGPPDLAGSRDAFKGWCRSVVKRGWCGVWRVEVQKRGSLHWHLLLGLPCGTGVGEISGEWATAVASMGWCEVPATVGQQKCLARWQREGEIREGENYAVGVEGGTVALSSRMLIAGAWLYAVDVQRGGNEGAWLRYLQDHATKCKQEQLSENIGRHWGVIGRSHFREVPGDVESLSPREYSRVVRWAQRLATPRVKDPRAPFGRRAGYRIRRGSWGRSVWFTHPETIERMIAFARSS